MDKLSKMPNIGDIIKHRDTDATYLVLDTHDRKEISHMEAGEVTVLTLKNDRTKTPPGGMGRMLVVFHNWYLVASAG